MEFLQLRCQRVTRATARTRKNQQRLPSAQVSQREIAALIQPWQPEIRRRRAGFQTVPFYPAALERTVTETAVAVLVNWPRATLSHGMGEGLGVRAAFHKFQQRISTQCQA